MNIKKETYSLLILDGLKMFMDLFSGPFLVTYFVTLSANSVATVSVYDMVMSFCLAIGSNIVGRIIRNKFKLGMYRLGILINIVYILCFIALGDRVVNYVVMIAVIYGLSSACYWYPLTILKAVKVGDVEKQKFFTVDRIIITAVAIIGPLVLGTVIAKLNYIQTAYMIAIISVFQLIISFFISPVPKSDNPQVKIKEAFIHFNNDRLIKKIMASHFCMGLNVNAGALGVLAMIRVAEAVNSDQKVGYITSIASTLAIVGMVLFAKYSKSRNPRRFVYACGIIPILVYLAQFLSGSMMLGVIFYIAYYSMANTLTPIHDVYHFSALTRTTGLEKYKDEYFAISEDIIGAGRVVGFGIVLIAAVSQNDILMDIVTWILVLSLFMNSWFINHFEET